MKKSDRPFQFVKGDGSEISCLCLGAYHDTAGLGQIENLDTFFLQAEADRIRDQYRNRARKRFAPNRLLRFRFPISVEIVKPRVQS
jgi:hypothetical protein